jgi:hypothetical protein
MPDWDRVEKDLRWCLLEGRSVDGRDVLFDSLQMTDPVRARSGLHNGFVMSFREDENVANFVACQKEDGARLLNLGRSIIGLKPLPA